MPGNGIDSARARLRGCGLLLANVNHSSPAQSLVTDHELAESGYSIAVVTEPHHVPPNHPRWVGGRERGSVAVHWRSWQGAPSTTAIETGDRHVAVRWGPIAVVGAYLSPRADLATFEGWLSELEACVGRLRPGPVLVAGDFNSWSTTWGSRATNPRGEALERWAAALGLVLLNQGRVPTCVRSRGKSIVDLMWATPSVARWVTRWEVDQRSGALSDHRYVRVELRALASHLCRPAAPRWALAKLDEDALVASVTASVWERDSAESPPDSDPLEGAEWLRGALTTACNAAMPLSKPRPRRAAYWWTEEIAELRRASVRLTRRLSRFRGDRIAVAELAGDCRAAKAVLRAAIRKAKGRAWEEFLLALNEDPWGRPYKMVLSKLRPWAPPLTESLDPGFVTRVITTLFPEDLGEGELPAPPFGQDSPDWRDELGVSQEELVDAARRGFRGNTAPGPDGIHKRIHALTLGVLAEDYRRVFTACLRRGIFPPMWRRAKLVLLHKEGRDRDLPSAYRPICLLDESGKLFERVIANRLVQHLSQTGPNLNGAQYGFREGLSTVDAVLRVKALSEEMTAQGGVALGVSLDIRNAFNTLPWGKIRESLRRHEVPPYLIGVVSDYLRDRWVEYRDSTGTIRRERLHRGVPQGSVLGPLLWNLGYDPVLRSALPPDCHVVCYADDTIVVAGGRDWGEALSRGERAVGVVMRSIHELGLEVAVNKTEALFFYKRRRRPPPPGLGLAVGSTRVGISPTVKYLGLILDGRWSFGDHFAWVARRAGERAAALSRLLPNLGGPEGKVRRLYASTVRSIALYGAPVWAGALAASRVGRARMARAFRPIAARAVRAYRTVSHTAATVLAGLPPMEILATEHARVFQSMRDLRGRRVTAAHRVRIRLQHRQRAFEEWRESLRAPGLPGRRVVEAILPALDRWVERPWGGLSYRVTQVLSGHGCFGRFLCRIGKERDAGCHHCAGSDDSAQHTLAECPAWEVQRAELVRHIGADLSLPAVIAAILAEEGSWRAFCSFCESVLKQKEQAERERRGEAPVPAGTAPGRRRRRRGVARRRLAPMQGAQPPPPPPPSTPTIVDGGRVLRPRPVPPPTGAPPPPT